MYEHLHTWQDLVSEFDTLLCQNKKAELKTLFTEVLVGYWEDMWGVDITEKINQYRRSCHEKDN